MIDCERHLVRVQNPSGGELIIHVDGTQRVLNFCPAMRGRRYLQKGCSGFMAYVMDSRVMERKTVGDVPII